MIQRKPQGKYTWIPQSVVDEITDIKREESIDGGADAFRQMVKHCRVGREMERLVKLDFSKATIRLPVEHIDFNIPAPEEGQKKWKKNNAVINKHKLSGDIKW